jgi:hypothetical protein
MSCQLQALRRKLRTHPCSAAGRQHGVRPSALLTRVAICLALVLVQLLRVINQGAAYGAFGSLTHFQPGMTHRYGNGTSAADYLEKAQLEAYESHRAMFEACTIDQTRPDQTRPDQTRPDQTRPDQTRAGYVDQSRAA